jgi:hypothetical protein
MLVSAVRDRPQKRRKGKGKMRVKIIQWVTTPYDTRDTASDITSGDIECVNAVAVARDLDKRGEGSEYAKSIPPRKEGRRLAVGHGVTVVYANGNTRRVRAF